jgi:hypothetical protein
MHPDAMGPSKDVDLYAESGSRQRARDMLLNRAEILRHQAFMAEQLARSIPENLPQEADALLWQLVDRWFSGAGGGRS